MFSVEFYQAPGGGHPAAEFLEGLEKRARAKAAKWLQLLEERGPGLPRPYAAVLEDGIHELRVAFGRLEIRVLYFIEDRHIVLTGGFLKKTQAVPAQEIRRAQKCRADWLQRSGGL